MSVDLSELASTARLRLYPNYRQPDMVLTRGQGCSVWDSTGKRYLDLMAGIAVCSLGHAHPAFVRAVAEQAGKLAHVSNYFYNEPNLRLAVRLTALTGMDRAFFCNSGTEAVEALLKVARRHFFARGQQDRHRIIAFERSFHGRTLGALAATGQAGYREGFGPLQEVIHVPYGDAHAVSAAMSPEVAGILVEPVQGEGGVVPAPEGFLAELRNIADQHGALLLADEIQTGVGRTGKFLAFEHSGVRPDALALAKALGGGVPIGAMLCREELATALPPGSHGSTFGGNPLASAAALAVLDVIEAEGLVEAAARLGEHLHGLLADLAARHPRAVSGVRGRGLLQGLILADDVDARALLVDLRERGLLLTLAGGQVLRLSPPLIITRVELELGASTIGAALAALPAGAGS